MTTAAIIKSKLTLDVAEFVGGAGEAVEVIKETKQEAKDFADAADVVGDKFDETGQSIDKWINALTELSPETQKFRGEWEGILEQFRSGEKDMKTTLEDLKDLKERMSEGEEGTIDFSKSLTQMAKGLAGVSGIFMLGRAIMSYTKNALDAAAVSGKLGAEFDKNEKASKRLTLAIGVQLGRATKDAVGWFAELKNEMAENIEKGNEMAEMFELLGYSSQEIAEYYGRVRVGLDDAGESYANLIEQVEALNIAEESEMETAMRAAKVAAERGHALNEMAESMGAMTEEAEEAANAFEGVETGITGMIESALRMVEWERAGGAEFAESFKEFWDAVVTGAITDESIIDAGLQMFEAAALGLEKKVGEIDWYSAAERYQEQFGGTLRDANEEIMLNWGAMEVYLNDVDFDTIAQTIANQLNLPLDEVTAHLFAIIAKMRAIDGMVSRAEVIITTYEQTATSFGQTGPVGQTGAIGKQHGGRFFAGQTMLVGEAGIERITAGVGGTVTPNEALDNSGIEDRLDSLEEAVLNMGEDMLTGISMLVG